MERFLCAQFDEDLPKNSRSEGRLAAPGGTASAHTDPSLFCVSKLRRVQPHRLASIQSGVLPIVCYNRRLPFG